MADKQEVSRALMGLSAGLRGDGPQYLAGLKAQDMADKQQQQAAGLERAKAMVKDAQTLNGLLSSGNVDQGLQLVNNRIKMIGVLGGDPSDTMRVKNLLESGDVQGAQSLVQGLLVQARSMGLLEQPQQVNPNSLIEDRFSATFDPITNQYTATDVYEQAGITPQEQEPTFRMLGAPEAAQMGLDGAGRYQIDDKTGRITSVGGNAPVTNVNLPSSVDEGTKEYGKGIGTRANARVEQANNALSQNAALQRMSEAVESGAQSGLGQETILDVKNLANSLFGIPIDPAAGEQEVLRALSNRLVMEVRNPASGLGLSGSTSNRDLDFLTASVPSLAKTPIGNALLVEYLMKQNQFKVDVANEQQKIIDDNGGIVPSNLDSRLMRFVNSYEFLDDDFRNDVETAVRQADVPQGSRFQVEVLP